MINIEDDIKILKDKDCLWIYSEDDILKAQEHILAEREQDKARIKELEDKLQEINGYILTKGIDEPLKTATQIECEYQKQYIIQQEITRLKQYAKELMKEKQQLTTALLDSIPKQKVKDKIEDIKKGNYSSNYNFKGGRENGKNFKFGFKVGMLKALKELLEEGANK